jgi:D-alanyl-D-alanine carboxypeptidase-like protein
LSALQEQMAQDAAKLIQQAALLGYTVTLGEAWRTPQQAQANAAAGTGISNSLHIQRLAIDLNFFKSGIWVTDGSELADVGAWWKSLGSDHYWGGDFVTRPDGNHFSISPDGGATK